MNSNLAEVGKPTRWPPGQSGNPAGKPPGTRTAFSQGLFATSRWSGLEEGLEAVRKEASTCAKAGQPGHAKQVYLEKYPEGEFKPLAEIRLRELGAPP